MRVYNTLTQTYEQLTPQNGTRFTMYVCGLTPYSHFHLGHARTYSAFDVIIRYLRLKGYDVFYIQNITDVDDKLIAASKETKRSVGEIAHTYMGEALRQMDMLNIARANVYPKVSEHIPEIIALIERLIEKGHAYEVNGNVYFSVSSFPEYGKLSKKHPEELRAGARIEPGEDKRDPADFALWKKKKPDEPISFSSPWGEGRPGWHIECSAMSTKYAGATIDIHGGALDLVFPHHENEIAQSESAFQKPFVRFWIHTGFLTVNGQKMSKSLKNFITVGDVLATYHPEVLRLFFAQTHYRSPIDFSFHELDAVSKTLEKLYTTLAKIELGIERGKGTLEFDLTPFKKKFEDAMDDDFSTPRALAVLFDVVSKVNEQYEQISPQALSEIREFLFTYAGIFGLLTHARILRDAARPAVNVLLSLRDEARHAKNYALADKIRALLKERGILIIDEKIGSAWYHALTPLVSRTSVQ